MDRNNIVKTSGKVQQVRGALQGVNRETPSERFKMPYKWKFERVVKGHKGFVAAPEHLKKDKRICVSFTDDQYQMIDTFCNYAGQSRPDFIRYALYEFMSNHYSEVVDDKGNLLVDEKQLDLFGSEPV